MKRLDYVVIIIGHSILFSVMAIGFAISYALTDKSILLTLKD